MNQMPKLRAMHLQKIVKDYKTHEIGAFRVFTSKNTAHHGVLCRALFFSYA